MKYYMATRNRIMVFYPNGMRYLHRGELLTPGEMRKYGIDDCSAFEEVSIKKTDTYRIPSPNGWGYLPSNGTERRLVRFA